MIKFFSLLVLCVQSPAYAVFERYRATQAYQHGDLDTAQHLLEPLFMSNQDDAQTAYNLGKIAYKKGEFAAAAAYTERAAECAQEKQLQIQAFFDTGNAYVKQEKWHEALKNYEQVLECDPEHKEARDMVEQIKKLLEEQEKQEQEQQKQQQHEKDQKDQKQQEKSDINNDQRNQGDDDQKNDQKPQDDKGTQERKQQGEEDKQQKEQKQPQSGEGNEPQEESGRYQGREQQEQGEQHDSQSSTDQQKPKPFQDTHGEKKEQANEQKPETREELLMSLLEERDAQLVKEMLQAQVKQAPRKHGQKNW